MKIRISLAAAAVAAVLGSTWGLALPAAASTPAFKITPTPVGNGRELTAVSCPSVSYCMAVSDDGIAIAWNGTTWSSLPSPANPIENLINGVACPAANDCMAVGFETASGTTDLAEAWSWNGTKWMNTHAFNTGSTQNSLSAIWCASASDCEAVGSHENDNGSKPNFPLAEKWNGSTWADQPTTGSPSAGLTGVACITASQCEAVGINFSQQPNDTAFAMGLSGSDWISQTLPSAATSTFSELNSVSCYAGGCTAAGAADNLDSTLALAWNRSTWALQAPLGAGNPAGESAAWNGISCQSASACTAAGQWFSPNGGYPHVLANTWNGSTWTRNSVQVPKDKNDQFNGISCSAGVCTVAGFQDTNFGSLAERN
jgi:hypothetical protein